jgi:hypothetical protein
LFAARQLNIKNSKISPKLNNFNKNQQATSSFQKEKDVKSSASNFSIASVLTPKIRASSIHENLNKPPADHIRPLLQETSVGDNKVDTMKPDKSQINQSKNMNLQETSKTIKDQENETDA